MNREQYERVLRDIARAGGYHTPQQGMGDLLVAAEASGFSICRIDLAPVRDKAALFERVATALEFPDWFGHNWDALADCLGDLSWLPADGFLILLEHCDGFSTRHSGDSSTALPKPGAMSAYPSGCWWTCTPTASPPCRESSEETGFGPGPDPHASP